MAKRTKSGLKRKRQAAVRTARNQAVRSQLKTLVKKAREVGATSTDDLRAALRALDAAARKGVVHRNAAARKKSRLMKRVARAGAPA
ncbi:MAG TPA: 30S ribosomal protein S20 [bacterium]|nr:30S ribosomal protein S20 [bacterium]